MVAYAVVWTDLLTDVAACDPVLHLGLEVGRDIGAVLEGKVADAAGAIY